MIPDSDLVNGIGFLIDAGVIRIGAMPGGGGEEGPSGQGQRRQGSGAAPTVPGRVKTGAGRWAAGMIGDAEFVRGMEFLASDGAMRAGR